MATGFAVYYPALSNHLVLDDVELIANNAALHSLANIPAWFFGSTMNSGGAATMAGMYYRPVTTLFFALIWAAGGESPWGFHCAQLVLHVANAFLLFLITRRFVTGAGAGAVALLFLVRPVNTECVVYIADAQDGLFTLFGLGALLYAAHARRAAALNAAVLGLLLLASLMAKESGLFFLLMVAAYAGMFRRELLKPALIAGAAALGIYLFLRIGVAHLTAVAHNVALRNQQLRSTRRQATLRCAAREKSLWPTGPTRLLDEGAPPVLKLREKSPTP